MKDLSWRRNGILSTCWLKMIRIYLTRKQEADALRRSEANLNATINNTTFFIWSINRKYQTQEY